LLYSRALVVLLVACVPAPIVQAPITVVVQPAPAPSCIEERVLIDDALREIPVDAGEDAP
jgi:hypothetical protein